MSMSEYVRSDYITRIPIQGGELLLSAAYDCIHHFSPIGAMMLKYWNQEKHSMHNVLISEEQGATLSLMAGLSIVERPFILATEHENIVQWRSDQLAEGDFGI